MAMVHAILGVCARNAQALGNRGEGKGYPKGECEVG